MLKLLLMTLKYETEIAVQMKAKGHKVVKPSLILLGAVTLFYCLSSIDLVPELLVKPTAFGLIDDLIVLTAYVVYLFSNVNINVEGGIESVQNLRVPDFTESIKKVRLPNIKQRDTDVSAAVVTNSSVSSDNSSETVDRPFVFSSTVSSDNLSPTGQSTEDGQDTAGAEFTAEEDDFFTAFFDKSGH